MRSRVAAFGLLAALASIPALAQISVDEAYEKLKAREAQKQAVSTQPVQTTPMIRVQAGMALQDRAAAILAAQIAVSKASDDLGVAVAAADARATKSPEYQQLLAQAAAAKDRATQSGGTREEQQAAASAADTAQQLCDVSRRALVKEDKDVLAKNKTLTLQQIKLWSLSATDLFDGLRKPEDFAKSGTWKFRGDTLVASGIPQASGIVFPDQLPARYVLRLEVGPCDMQWLEIMVPVGNGMTTVQYGRLSSAHPHTFGIFVVDPSAQPSVVSNTFANPGMLTCTAQPPAVASNDAQIPGFINELNREVHQAPANNEPSILVDKFPTILGRAQPHASGIVVASATVPFYAILAIPCKDIDEANEILAEPVYLGAAWQPPDDKPTAASHATKSTDTNANGSHSLIPHQDPPPEYHPSFPVGNLGPANR